MFQRLLYPDGTLRVGRLVVVLPICFVLAMFGPAALWIVPKISDGDGWRWAWVIIFTFLLKVPLILLAFMFIRRNLELPTKPPVWHDGEAAQILQALRDQAEEAAGKEDRAARLAYLSREAWHVADRVSGSAKTDALTVALQIDEQLMELTERESRP